MRGHSGADNEQITNRTPPHPDSLTQFFARTLPCNTTQHPQKIGGEGGNMALSSQTLSNESAWVRGIANGSQHYEQSCYGKYAP